MITSERRCIVLCILVGLLVIFACGPARAIPVRLPSGKVIDLTPGQVELLKQSPGVYYFNHRPDKIINERIRHWTLIELPQELGGGFLIGRPQNLAQGLEMLDAREIQDSGIQASKSSPEGSDSKAGIKPAGTKVAPHQHDWQWSIDIGYRTDDIDWNIAGFTPTIFLIPPLQGVYVNILSELSWSNLEIFQMEFSLERRIQRKYKIRGTFAYGVIFDGENQDSDYAGNNRTFEFSRANNSADDGSTSDVSIGFGYNFSFLSDAIGLTPLIGFSYHSQNLTMTEGVQNVSDFGWPSALGPFPGLNSSYDAKWYGPWVGLDLNARIYKRDGTSLAHEILFGIEYHWANYHAEANWNLRTDFDHPKSFEHEADGSGIVFWAGYNYFFNPQGSLNLSGKYQEWQTDPGIDRIFFSNGTVAETRLNEVNWESYSLMLGATFRF
jgi:hypothetical protein